MIERGAIFAASEKGALTGKPRPVLVVQNDTANRIHSTVTVCLISSVITEQSLFRVSLEPTSANGLLDRSEVQADRLYSFRRESLGDRIGQVSAEDLARVDTALRLWLHL